MTDARGSLEQFFSDLSAPDALLQFACIGAVVILAALAQRLTRRWYQRNAGRYAGGWHSALVEAAAIEAPYVLALLLLLMVRTIIAGAGLPIRLLDAALQLATVLILVRLATYSLRLMLGPSSWLRNWERPLTLILWLAISFELIGWFDSIQGALDAINLVPGNKRFTLWSLLKGLVVITGFVLIASVIGGALERRILRLTTLALSTRVGITKFTYFFLVGLGTLLGINAAGVDFTALTVLTGAIGLGLGFGLQSIASNFVSGFVLLLDKSIKPGDVISFTNMPGTSTESFGWVQELRGRYVVVRDRDGVETLVPNQTIINNHVINWSYSDRKIRLKLPVRISYADDPERALDILVRATAGNPRVLHEPAPVSRLMQFGDSGMDLELRFWISDPESGVNNVRSDVNRVIWRLFKEAGITIPVAQREIRVIGGEPGQRDPRA
jgi:small-conductance mechanosensitive channel